MAGNRKLTVEIGGNASGALRAFEEVHAGAASAFDKLAAQGNKIALVMGGGAIAAGAAIYKIGTQYRDSLNEFQAVSGATEAQMARIRVQAKALGADMSLPATSAGGAAKAMTELAKAGFTVDQALKASKGTLMLAAAAQIDESRAAEISSNALNAFGLSADRAGKVVDILANTANQSSVEITDVADSFKMAGAVFNSMQGQVVGSEKAMKELAVATGLLGNAGIKGSDAGTSLKQMLLQLSGPSGKSKNEMIDLAHSIGVTGDIAYDAQGKMRPLNDIISLTSRATANLTQEERNRAITQIFGADASRAVLVLMAKQGEETDRMTAAIDKNGSAQELAAAKMKGLHGAMQGLQSQLETIGIEIFEKVEPAFEAFVRIIADKLPPAFETAKRILATVMDKLQPLGDWMSKNQSTVKVFFEVLAGAAVVGMVAALVAALASFIGVVGAVVIAIAGLAAGVKYAYEHWGWFRDAVDKTVAWLRANVPPAFEMVKTALKTAVDNMVAFWHQWGDEITGVAKTIWATVKGVVEGAMQAIGGAIKTIGALIKGDWSGVWDGIKQVVTGALKEMDAAMRGAATLLGAAAKALGKAILSGLGDLGNLLVNAGKDVVRGLINGMKSMIPDVGSVAKSIASTVSSGVKGLLGIKSPSTVMFGYGENTTQGFVLGLESGITKVQGAMGRIVTAVRLGGDRAIEAAAYGAEQISRALGGDRAIELAGRSGSDVAAAFSDSLASQIAEDLPGKVGGQLEQILKWTVGDAQRGQFATGTDANGNTIQGRPFAANPDGSTMVDGNGNPIYADDTAGITAASRSQFGSSGGTVIINNNVQGSVISAQDLVSATREGLVKGQVQGYSLVI